MLNDQNCIIDESVPTNLPLSNAAAVKRTNDSCTVSKWSVAVSGYYEDSVLGCFVDPKSKKRASLINRCYCVRNVCLDMVVSQFFYFVSDNFSNSPVQIVVLGAGFDSSFWRLCNKYPNVDLRFVEIDFPDVCRRKCSLARSAGHIQHEQLITDKSDNFMLSYNATDSKHFISAGCDMSDKSLFQQLLCKVVQKNVPTLVISEVVLVYLKMEDRLSILSSVFELLSKEDLITFFTYEQIADPEKDAFSRQMLTSFSQSQSPLLSYFTSPQEVVNFWLNNFPNCEVIFKTCAELFYKSLLCDERQFCCNLEPVFDEFEPYHVKCAIYFVVSACFGKLGHEFAQYCRNNKDKPAEITPESLDMQKFSADAPIRCYAFSCAKIGGNVCAFVGGFGCQQKAAKGVVHGRTRCVGLLQPHTGQAVPFLKLHGNDNSFFDRLYGSTTTLSDGRIFVFGGRQSPNSAVLSYGIIRINDETCFIDRIGHLVGCGGDENKPHPRFRHAACSLTIQGCDFVFLNGGRFVDSKQTVFDDCWLYDIVNSEWICLSGTGMLKRHSHSTVSKNTGEIIVFGGLDQQEMPLSDLSCVKVDLNFSITATKIVISPFLEPRYGHSAEIFKDNYLIIVGGICPFAEAFTAPDIVVANLTTGSSRFFSAKPSPSPFMFMNHCSFIENDEKLVVFGGGANCFSFGTHFNSQFLRIPLEILAK